jgi:hypothetical protein
MWHKEPGKIELLGLDGIDVGDSALCEESGAFCSAGLFYGQQKRNDAEEFIIGIAGDLEFKSYPLFVAIFPSSGALRYAETHPWVAESQLYARLIGAPLRHLSAPEAISSVSAQYVNTLKELDGNGKLSFYPEYGLWLKGMQKIKDARRCQDLLDRDRAITLQARKEAERWAKESGVMGKELKKEKTTIQ